MNAKSIFLLWLCGALIATAVAALPMVATMVDADEINVAAQPTRLLTVKRFASQGRDVGGGIGELCVDITATETDGKLNGEGRFVMKWTWGSPRGDTQGEVDETVRAEGTLDGDHVRLRIVSPQQVTLVVKKAPPPVPNVPLKDQVHVGSVAQWPMSNFGELNVFEGTLVQGRFERQGPVTFPSGVWNVATEMDMPVAGPALVERLTIGGRVEVGDVFRVEIGEAAVSISAAEPNPTATAGQLAAAWNASEAAQGTGVVAAASGADVWLTVNDPAHAFTCQIDTTEADGPSSDGQTFASSRRFIAGGLTAGYWKKEIRHCNRLLTTWYSEDPSPTVGFFQSFQCPVCGEYTKGGEWELVMP